MTEIAAAVPKIASMPKFTPDQVEAARIQIARRNALCDPDCPECGGIGYIRVGLGLIKPCPTLFQRSVRLNPDRYGLARIEVDQLDWSQIQDYNGALSAAKQVQARLELGYGWVFMWGSHGLAKTLILKIAIAARLRSGQEAAYCNMRDLIANLRSAYDADEDSEQRLSWWRQLPVLAIDEFNRLKESEWVSEQRFALMDARYVQAQRQESLTLIASNSPPEQQESYLADRIRDGRFEVIELKGTSARPSMRPRHKF